MNLRDLHYLTTIAETLHFGRAAAACHVSQPTLSMQLKKLEETLGVALFERSNKRVMLTPAGHEIASKAREILQDVAQMKALAQSRRDPLAGRVTLGLFPTLAPYVLPHVMPALTQHFPSIEWRLIEEKTPVLEAQLQSGALDVALLAAPVDLTNTTQHFLFHEPFLLALGTSHPLARQKRIRRERMASTNLLLLEEGHCLRDQSLSYCERLGMGESQQFRATSLETLRHMVASSDAVTLMPQLAASPSPGIRYLPFAGDAPGRDILLVSRAQSPRQALFMAMAALIPAQIPLAARSASPAETARR